VRLHSITIIINDLVMVILAILSLICYNSLMNHETTGSARVEIPIDTSVLLRNMVEADAASLFALIDANRAHLSQYGDHTSEKYPDLESVTEKMNAQSPLEHRFGIWDKESLVGFIKLTETPEEPVEIGYWLGSEFQHKGYMARSVKALTDYAVNELGYDKVIAKVHKQNVASQRVLTGSNYAVMGNVPGDPEWFLYQYENISPEEREKRKLRGYAEIASEIDRRSVYNRRWDEDSEEPIVLQTLPPEEITQIVQLAMKNSLNVHWAYPGKNEKVLRLRYGLDDGVHRTLQQTGEIVGLSRERIRQVVANSLRYLTRDYVLHNTDQSAEKSGDDQTDSDFDAWVETLRPH
jgi:ribosomal-protein-serine acetyltransferase